MRGVAPAGPSQVRSGHPAFVAKPVAHKAACRAKHLASLVKVAPFHPAGCRGREFLERPVGRGAAGKNRPEVFEGRLFFRFPRDQFGQNLSFGFREGG